MDVDKRHWRRAVWKVFKEYLGFLLAIAAIVFVIIGAWVWSPIVVLVIMLAGFAITSFFLIWCMADDIRYEASKTAHEMEKEKENVAEG